MIRGDKFDVINNISIMFTRKQVLNMRPFLKPMCRSTSGPRSTDPWTSALLPEQVDPCCESIPLHGVFFSLIVPLYSTATCNLSVA